MHYYQRNIGSYQKKTQTLSLLEHGAYCLLIDNYFATEARIPLEMDEVYRICRAVSRKDRAAVTAVLKKYFTMTDTGYVHSRCEEEIEAYRSKSMKLKQNGSKGGQAAREKRVANATPIAVANAVANGVAKQQPTINQEPITNNQDKEEAIFVLSPSSGGGVAAEAIREVVDSWNEMAVTPLNGICLIRVREGPLTDSRKRSLKARLSELDFRENWRAAMERVRVSQFCHGSGNRQWVADFDWFIKKGTLCKIMEGKYDDRSAAVGQRDNVGSPNRYRQGDFATKAAEAMRRAEEKGSSFWSDEEPGQEPSA
jgi:uncharacterized protein YdaU (DUF1376 family)